MEKDVLETHSFSSLVDWGNQFRKPAGCIKNPPNQIITCYEFDNMRKVFLFGFTSGEVGVVLLT
jgi:hypothetical protein